MISGGDDSFSRIAFRLSTNRESWILSNFEAFAACLTCLSVDDSFLISVLLIDSERCGCCILMISCSALAYSDATLSIHWSSSSGASSSP